LSSGADPALAWRIEQACFHAWPALEQVEVGDWTVRFGRGLTRRNNSANPTRADARLSDAEIEACAGIYARWGQPTIFRLPSFLDPEADRRLERLGFSREEDVLTLVGDADALACAPDPQARILETANEDWLAARSALAGLTPAETATYAEVVRRLALPGVFAAVSCDGEPASMAYGALHDGLLCIESVVTAQAWRGRGLAHRMLGALFAHASARGCHGACLQVRAENAPAIALYRRLGLTREVYRYHYRRRPQPA
jgi:ribosomal protein S18 acetylase RimI-like enzyme